MNTDSLYGGLEAGGTKFVCIVGRGPTEIVAEQRIPTTTPETTLSQVVEFFRPFCSSHGLRSIGVGSFGPCDLERGSATYGFITSTPKPGWQNTNVVGALKASLPVQVSYDTDVNAAAFGEYLWGAGRGVSSCLYLTIGTGIGGGYVLEGRALHGLQHPEMGHIRIPHDRAVDSFAGSCPFHGDCLEGLASGPAIQQRFGIRGEALDDSDPFWELEAQYLGAAIAIYILVLSPARIVIGGGIMGRTFLLPRVRHYAQEQLAGYIRQPALLEGMDGYLVAPGLGARSGVLGALALGASQVDRHLGDLHA